MSIDKKRWIILVAACLINLCLGSIYAWSVFASSMSEYLSQTMKETITVADLAIVYTVANSVGPITMISGGWFNDRLGPKRVIAIGGIMFGVGMILSGYANSITFLMLSYGILAGLGLGMAYGSTISTCVKYFPDKRGLIGGITTAVYGLSSVILPPLVTIIVEKWDATIAFKSIGLCFLIIIIICTFFMEQCPQGYLPKGYQPSVKQSQQVDMNWKEMMKSPIFYCMILLLTSGAFSGMMVISQASGIAQNMVGMSAIAASGAVSILSLFNALGRIVAGYISDKIGRIHTLMMACILSILGMLCLYMTGMHSEGIFFIGISIIGISFGAFMGVYPGFTADQFGARYNSVNYGIMFIGFALAGYFGPQVMRTIYMNTNTYQNAFLIACGCSVFGVLCTLVYKVMQKKSIS